MSPEGALSTKRELGSSGAPGPAGAENEGVGLPSPDLDVHAVGFRRGTDRELAAQHLVEAEIESERHPASGHQPLESYVAFARSLPSQFDDHTWIAEEPDGTPAGSAACWSNAAGDPRIMQGYVYVRRPWRRRGLGWRLLNAVVDEASAVGRPGHRRGARRHHQTRWSRRWTTATSVGRPRTPRPRRRSGGANPGRGAATGGGRRRNPA